MEPPFLVKIPGVPRPFGSFVKLSEGAFSFPSLIVTDLSGFSLAGVEDSYPSMVVFRYRLVGGLKDKSHATVQAYGE